MPEPKTYTGGCHCGEVRFEVTPDISNVVSCNCSICQKRGALWSFVPAGNFGLRAGARRPARLPVRQEDDPSPVLPPLRGRLVLARQGSRRRRDGRRQCALPRRYRPRQAHPAAVRRPQPVGRGVSGAWPERRGTDGSANDVKALQRQDRARREVTGWNWRRPNALPPVARSVPVTALWPCPPSLRRRPAFARAPQRRASPSPSARWAFGLRCWSPAPRFR